MICNHTDKNGDVRCGGTCADINKCDAGKKCKEPTDCKSNICQENKTCAGMYSTFSTQLRRVIPKPLEVLDNQKNHFT